MSEIFNSGDIVKLKSGSPKMTVDGYSNLDEVICVWYDENKRDFVKKKFSEESLEHHDPEDDKPVIGVRG